jgi:AFG3 family protein
MTNAENKQPDGPSGKPGGKVNWITITYLALIGLFVSQLFFFQSNKAQEINWTRFETEMLDRDDVERLVVVNKERVEIYIKTDRLGGYDGLDQKQPGPHFYFTIGSVEAFETRLEAAQDEAGTEDRVPVRYIRRTNWGSTLLAWLLPFAIIIGIWLLIFRNLGRRMGGGGANAFDFGKSKARVFDTKNHSKVTFDDVAGYSEAKIEIKEIVDFLKNPEQYTRLGAKIPKGVILSGPPGTGKTLMAKAVAGEAQVPFFSISGSEFVEMFVGVGASRVRDLFRKAQEKSPSIIFIDEIDAIGRSRGKAISIQTNDERESTLNQLLTEMDGFGANAGVIVIAATNRPDILDKALLRPGRFDRHIYLELPSMEERMAIFKVHLKDLKLTENIQIKALAAQTPGFSGADIANICNEAALIAARKKKDLIYYDDFNEAIDRVVGGLERKGKIISPKEKETIAYHEAGHATASWYLEHADELVKVSIIPRGKSLGAAWYLPEERVILTKAQLMDRLCVALGGRASEELTFGEISSGALDDLEKVTKQAYTMVVYYGLNKRLGNISFYDSSGQYEQSLQKPYSDETAKIIDEEVRALIQTAYDRTKKILREHKKELTDLAELLLQKEIVYQEDLEKLFGKRLKKEIRALPKVPA